MECDAGEVAQNKSVTISPDHADGAGRADRRNQQPRYAEQGRSALAEGGLSKRRSQRKHKKTKGCHGRHPAGHR